MVAKTLFHLPIARYSKILWFMAIIITISSAVFQRLTGPTYPVIGKKHIDSSEVSYKLLRSETVQKDAQVLLTAPDTTVYGFVRYKRFKSYDEWSTIPLKRENEILFAFLPEQPPAGKLMYTVYLTKGAKEISLTDNETIILRYKGNVPAGILIPHIIFMFMAMLFSNRAALETLDAKGKAKKYMYWTISMFFIGGFILGPLVQKFAFGSYWEGIPFGYDLTDNKTLIGMLGWIWAWWKNRKDSYKRGWILFASLLMLVVYLIPHSLLGSEIDYTRVSPPGEN